MDAQVTNILTISTIFYLAIYVHYITIYYPKFSILLFLCLMMFTCQSHIFQ